MDIKCCDSKSAFKLAEIANIIMLNHKAIIFTKYNSSGTFIKILPKRTDTPEQSK